MLETILYSFELFLAILLTFTLISKTIYLWRYMLLTMAAHMFNRGGGKLTFDSFLAHYRRFALVNIVVHNAWLSTLYTQIECSRLEIVPNTWAGFVTVLFVFISYSTTVYCSSDVKVCLLFLSVFAVVKVCLLMIFVVCCC